MPGQRPTTWYFCEGGPCALGANELAASAERQKELGRAGRERAVKEFDWERKIDRILEVYADTIERARGTARTADLAGVDV